MQDGKQVAKQEGLTGGKLVASILVLLVIISPFVGFGLHEEARYKEISSYRANHYAHDSDEAVHYACVSFTGRDKAFCLQEKGSEARLQKHNNERDEADLVAQRKSALWTSIMGFAALIGMGLSAVGVFLVWTTFRETQKQAQAAQTQTKLAMAQSSCDPKVQHVNLFVPEQPGNFGPQHVQVTVKNWGITDAIDLHVPKALVTSSDGRFKNLEMVLEDGYPGVAEAMGRGGSQGFPFSHPTFVFDETALLAGDYLGVKFTIEVTVEYKTILGETVTRENVWEGVSFIDPHSDIYRIRVDFVRRA